MFLLTGLFLALQQGDWGHPSCVCHHRSGHFSNTPVWPKCYISSHSHGYKHFLFHHTATIYPFSPTTSCAGPPCWPAALHRSSVAPLMPNTLLSNRPLPAKEIKLTETSVLKVSESNTCSLGPKSHNRLKKSVSYVSTPSDCLKKRAIGTSTSTCFTEQRVDTAMQRKGEEEEDQKEAN